MKSFKMNISKAVFIMLVVLCLLVTLIQGSSLATAFSRNVKMFICVLPIIIIWLGALFSSVVKKESLSEEKVVFAIIFSAMLLHCCYVLLSGLYERQHDEGVYTGIATSQVNPGHLGYIEYIYKFHKLPNINPYELFSYYHPPLHYIISALWLILLTTLGMPEDLAFENLQILPLFYSGMLMLVTYWILRKIGSHGRGLYAGLFLVAMHPALTIMSGSINNDMLATLLLACCMLASLCFIRERSFKNLMLIAFSISFGMLSKVHAAVLALPVGIVFLIDFVQTLKAEDETSVIHKRNVLNCVKKYVIFGVVSGVIGLSWIVRNLVCFHENPGVPIPPTTSVLYTGNYGLWERFGLASFTDWHFEFPFHPLSGKVIHNIWVIMFQTSLFAEEYPAGMKGLMLVLCQITYILSILSAIGAALLFIYTQYKKYKSGGKTVKLEAVFFLTGYAAFLLGFCAFFIKYPYTCSADFRYMVICLVYMAVGLADSSNNYLSGGKAEKIVSSIVRAGVYITMMFSMVIYLTWKLW